LRVRNAFLPLFCKAKITGTTFTCVLFAKIMLHGLASASIPIGIADHGFYPVQVALFAFFVGLLVNG
jgi:hypothetical protein